MNKLSLNHVVVLVLSVVSLNSYSEDKTSFQYEKHLKDTAVLTKQDELYLNGALIYKQKGLYKFIASMDRPMDQMVITLAALYAESKGIKIPPPPKPSPSPSPSPSPAPSPSIRPASHK